MQRGSDGLCPRIIGRKPPALPRQFGLDFPDL